MIILLKKKYEYEYYENSFRNINDLKLNKEQKMSGKKQSKKQ